jgi:hypothetical protein
MRHGTTLLTVLAIGGLLLGTLALAQGRFGMGPLGVGGSGPNAQAFGHRHATTGNHGALLQRLPIGTTATLTTFDGDPEADGEALTTLSITIGEDSEVAFARELDEAMQDAAFLRYDIGEATRTMELGDDIAALARRHGLGSHAFGAGIGVAMHAMDDGDTLSVSFYGEDPAQGGAPLQTLTFTFGVDSAIGFGQELHDAAAEAAYAVLTTSPRSLTVDLSEAPTRLGGAHFGGRPQAWTEGAATRMVERQSAQRMERMQHVTPPRGGPRR